MTLAFSYIRMSTPEQMKGDSLRRQMERSRQLAEAKGWTLDDSMKDLGKSAWRGSHVTDGALGEFLARVRAGRVPRGSVLIVESLDRLSREAPRVALARFLDIINAGIVLVTLDGDAVKEFRADTLNETDLIISIVGMARAYSESQRKSDMLKPAWANKRKLARETGKPLSGRLPMWLRLADGKIEVIEERAEVVRDMFQMTAEGIGREKLCRILNQRGIPGPAGGEWRLSSVTHVLESQAVIGRYQPKQIVWENGTKKRVPVGEPIEGYFPSIISLELFQCSKAARASRAINSGGRKGWTYSNLFRGLCHCGVCGSPMEYFNKGYSQEKGGRYFMCSSVKRGGGCTGKGSYSYDHFEDAFLSNCHHFDFARITAGHSAELSEVRERLAHLTDAKQGLETRYSNLLSLAEQTGPTERIKQGVAELEAALAANTAEVGQLINRQAMLSQATATDALRRLHDLRNQMSQVEGEALYRLRAQVSGLIREFVVAIFFEGGRTSVLLQTRNTALEDVQALYVFRRRTLSTRVRIVGSRGKDKEFFMDLSNHYTQADQRAYGTQETERHVQFRAARGADGELDVGVVPEGVEAIVAGGLEEYCRHQHDLNLGVLAVNDLDRYCDLLEQYREKLKVRSAGGPAYAKRA